MRLLICSVVVVHFLFCFLNFRSPSPTPIPKKSIIVHTFCPPPARQKPQTPVQIKKEGSTQGALQKESNRETLPSGAKDRGNPATIFSKQSAKKRDLLKELQESFSKIVTTPPPESTLSLPKGISSLHIDTTEKEIENTYSLLLAGTLKEALELPEHGVVKLELTVQKTGQVLKLNILHTASEINQRYLEINLPKLSLPPFNEELKNENHHTFVLTFCNED